MHSFSSYIPGSLCRTFPFSNLNVEIQVEQGTYDRTLLDRLVQHPFSVVCGFAALVFRTLTANSMRCIVVLPKWRRAESTSYNAIFLRYIYIICRFHDGWTGSLLISSILYPVWATCWSSGHRWRRALQKKVYHGFSDAPRFRNFGHVVTQQLIIRKTKTATEWQINPTAKVYNENFLQNKTYF